MPPGLSDVQNARELLRIILKREWWKDRIVNVTDRRQPYTQFVRFVTDPPVEGLGSTVQTLDTLARGDIELEDLLDKALQRPSGGDKRSDQYRITVDNVNNDTERPLGNNAAYALRKLRKDHLDL